MHLAQMSDNEATRPGAALGLSAVPIRPRDLGYRRWPLIIWRPPVIWWRLGVAQPSALFFKNAPIFTSFIVSCQAHWHRCRSFRERLLARGGHGAVFEKYLPKNQNGIRRHERQAKSMKNLR